MKQAGRDAVFLILAHSRKVRAKLAYLFVLICQYILPVHLNCTAFKSTSSNGKERWVKKTVSVVVILKNCKESPGMAHIMGAQIVTVFFGFTEIAKNSLTIVHILIDLYDRSNED